MKNALKHFSLYHLPALIYAGLILSLSSIPSLRTPEVRFLAFDKVAHFIEYALFAYLLFRSLYHLNARISSATAFFLSLVILILFATFDEYFVQTFSNRNTDIYDLIFDITGGILILLFLFLRYLKKEQKAPDV